MPEPVHDHPYGTNWRERTVLITGAAGGLGRALTQRYRRLGAKTALVDIDEEGLRRAADESGGLDDRMLVIPTDLAEASASDRIVSIVAVTLGGLDILVNNAALLLTNPIERVTPEEFGLMMNVNLQAPFFLSQSAVQVMKRQQRGRIINVSSIGARTGGAEGAAVYAMSKAGLVALTKAFARAYATERILVNSVAPGMMRTPMISDLEDLNLRRLGEVPLGRMSEPTEVAEVVVWLSSDVASYITGATIDVNGGWLMY